MYVSVMCLLAMPMSMTSLMLASIIEGSTLTPLFTLPIFILGFPRPISFWKGNWFRRKRKKDEANCSLDEAIYSAIGFSLVTEFVKNATISGRNLRPRDAFVARYEDRLLFLRILGAGLNFVYVGVKGLELQEQTSCHHQESAWMDEIFEKNAVEETHCCRVKNLKDKLTAVWPLFEVKVPAYSESKSTIPYLTSEHEKQLFEKFFFKAFSFLWIKAKPAFKGEAYWNGKRVKFYGISEDKDEKNWAGSRTSLADEVSNTEESIAQTQWPSPTGIQRGSAHEPPEDCATSWIKKCVGKSIPSKAIKDRMERLVRKIWKIVHNNNDFFEIKLHRYFEEDFLIQESHKIRTLDTENLVEITKKSFRYASKLTLDEIYQMDFTEESTGSTEDEIFTQLCRFESEFSFCQPTEISALLRKSAFPNFETNETILCITSKEEGMSQMRIFVPEKNGLDFQLGGFDQGVLEGIWANLNLELLYLTSDDDERFSIQHDRHLMRNLCTEGADTPLGYPVYEAVFRVDIFKDFKVDAVM